MDCNARAFVRFVCKRDSCSLLANLSHSKTVRRRAPLLRRSGT